MDLAFDALAGDAKQLGAAAFEELWRRHPDLLKRLRVDLELLLRDLRSRDAAERDALKRPFAAKKRGALTAMLPAHHRIGTKADNFGGLLS